MSLAEKYVIEVCQPGQGEATCSYLLCDSREGWQCGKFSSFRRVIDRPPRYRRNDRQGRQLSWRAQFSDAAGRSIELSSKGGNMPTKRRSEKLPYQRLSQAERRRTIGLLQKLRRLSPRALCRELIVANQQATFAMGRRWGAPLPSPEPDSKVVEQLIGEVVDLLLSCWINILFLALDKDGKTRRLDLSEHLLPAAPIESFFKGENVSSWYDLFVQSLAKHIDSARVPELVNAFTARLAREADQRGYLEVYEDRGGTVSLYPGSGKRGYFLA